MIVTGFRTAGVIRAGSGICITRNITARCITASAITSRITCVTGTGTVITTAVGIAGIRITKVIRADKRIGCRQITGVTGTVRLITCVYGTTAVDTGFRTAGVIHAGSRVYIAFHITSVRITGTAITSRISVITGTVSRWFRANSVVTNNCRTVYALITGVTSFQTVAYIAVITLEVVYTGDYFPRTDTLIITTVIDCVFYAVITACSDIGCIDTASVAWITIVHGTFIVVFTDNTGTKIGINFSISFIGIVGIGIVGIGTTGIGIIFSIRICIFSCFRFKVCV